MSRSHFLMSMTAVALAGASQAQVINEFRTDQVGTDNQEYFELAGSAGASLNALTYIVIGDGAGASGVIESVTSLAGFSLTGSGLFLAVEPSWTTSPPAGWPGGTPNLTTGANGLNFENGDNVTHMLVSGFTGANAQDLDTNDDGTLDVTPWTSILDSIAFVVDPTFTTSERIYSSTVLGPDGAFAPSHAFRSPNGTGGWVMGVFDGTTSGWGDTPGGINPVPEPATLAALALGAGVLLRRRVKR